MAEEAKRLKFADLPANAEKRTVDMLQDLMDRARVDSPATVRREMQDSMDDNASVFRTEDTLRKQEAILEGLQERYATRVGVMDKSKTYNTDLLEAVELGFLLDLAQTLVHGARARTESRGGHYRGDFPTRDDGEWLKHSLTWKTKDGLRLGYKPVTITRYQPEERKY